ncbi:MULTISPECIES: hypothetical protein [unclassified Nocardiopsis]|uniref:hypothetical protein n=1 Tax=unclassified Nocardiopsis TaxID=2649073 RepID=UPI00135A7671|nr:MULTISPECIES: hypothetical protein [unclassified Nocardiopsis]
MNRKSLTRIAFAAVAVPALAFGAPAAAMADSFFGAEATAAGVHGAANHSVTAAAFDGHGHRHGGGDGKGKDGDHWGGGSFYHKNSSWAGPHGAASHNVFSAAY